MQAIRNCRATIANSTLTVLLATTALAATPGYAQTPEAEKSSDDDIIVTAQRREENLQNVPISVIALGTKKLDQLNVANFQDFSRLLPSVSFQTIQPGSTTVYMRGVASGGDGNHSASLPSVGFYLDEQPVTTIGGTIDVNVYDIARIESLAGPQGTLFGASSQAGTVRIITNKPDKSGFAGSVDGEVNTVSKGGVGGRINGMINLPLTDMMALRVVGWYRRDAGYIDNVAGTRSFLPQPGGITVNNAPLVRDDFNTVDVTGGRAALQIDLNDSWTVTPSVLFQDQQNRGVFAFDPRVGDLQVQRFFPDRRSDQFVQAALTIEGKIGNWDVTYAGAYLDRAVNQQSDYTDYAEAYDQLYAASGGVAGYFYFENAAGLDIDSRQFVVGREKFRKLSQEVRISSPQDAPLRVIAGAFYQRQSNDILQDYRVAGLSPLLSVNGRPGTLWLTNQQRVDRDYALFGEVSYDILSNLTLTGGARVFRFDNTLIGFFGFGRNPNGPPFNAAGSSRTGVAGCFTTSGATLRDNPTGALGPAIVPGTFCTNLGTPNGGTIDPKQAKDDGFLHRLNLTWKPTEDALLYATWSRGFRPGGINRRTDVLPYDADFLTNYELGFKTTLLDGTLRFNGALYQQEWKSFQFPFLGPNSFTVILNGPDARIRGFEADVNWKPLSGLTLTASAAFTDAKTRQNLCAVREPTFTCAGAGNAILAPAGTRMPITPRFKGNAVARYDFSLGANQAHVQAVVAHSSSASADIRVTQAAQLGQLRPWTTADFAAGIAFGDYRFEAFVSNAFDERAEVSRGSSCGQCNARTYILVVRPRTIGLRVGTKF